MGAIKPLNYYDAQRAMFREIYTKENNKFKNAIGRCHFDNDELFRAFHSKLYEGIYTNAGSSLNGNNVLEDIHYLNSTKSSARPADFMTLVELKANSDAMYLATLEINALIESGRPTIRQVENICYDVGKEVGQELIKFRRDIDPKLFLAPDTRIENASNLVKRFDNGLKRGVIPTDAILRSPTPQKYNDLTKYRKNAVANYTMLLNSLKEMRFSTADIVELFSKMNEAYYKSSTIVFKKTDVEYYKKTVVDKFSCYKSKEELAKILEKYFKENRYKANKIVFFVEPVKTLRDDEKYYNHYSIPEVAFMDYKFAQALQMLTLLRQKGCPSFEVLKNNFYTVGEKARLKMIDTLGVGPEYCEGFFIEYEKLQTLLLKEKEEIKKAIEDVKNGKSSSEDKQKGEI